MKALKEAAQMISAFIGGGVLIVVIYFVATVDCTENDNGTHSCETRK